jgi:hypothetical protein
MVQKPKPAKHKRSPSELRRNKHNAIWYEMPHKSPLIKGKPGTVKLKKIPWDYDDISEEVIEAIKNEPVKKRKSRKPAKTKKPVKKPVKKPAKKPLDVYEIFGEDYLEI